MSITESPLTTNEKLVDLYMERAIDLLRLEAGSRDKVVRLLHDLENEISSALARSTPNADQRRRLQSLLEFVTASIRATYRLTNALMARELREVADIEAAWTRSAINISIQAEFAVTKVTRGFLESILSNLLIQGAPSAAWWGRQAQGLADRFADEMRRGMALGETNAQLIERLRGPSGLMQMAYNSAERLVRASVQTAANGAREAMYADNTDLIAALQWSATLDTRTSIWCLTRDKHLYSVDAAHEAKDGGPPWLEGPGKLHWGCRSTSVPVLKPWRELGIDADEVPETTRASMDGQVAADMSFEQWLRKQSVERQNLVLGDGKAELWRAGKITFRDLLDQNGRPLTTEQLREKYARRT